MLICNMIKHENNYERLRHRIHVNGHGERLLDTAKKLVNQ